ncbi:hypothetical protein, partial [Brevibacterium casei]|uniref:hypothetical protein n=1 Tax=Brevibacterium casei TaxID=33889 RepID=UPI001C92E6D9
ALAAHRRLRALGDSVRWPFLATVVTTLSLSTLIYIVGYFPIVPANHYRYVYWPAMAMTMCGVMVAAASAVAWKVKRFSRTDDGSAQLA